MKTKFIEIREAKGMSREQFAVASGLAGSTIYKFENSIGHLTPRILGKLATAYGVPLEMIAKSNGRKAAKKDIAHE